MNTKKWVFILIGMLVLSGIGGRMYMINQQEKAEQRQEKNKLRAEKKSVKVLKNTFKDIKSVEFKQTGHNEMTGSYRMYVKMTNSKNESVEFDYSFWKERNEIGSYGVENRDVQVEGVTTNGVQVIYSNQEKGEI